MRPVLACALVTTLSAAACVAETDDPGEGGGGGGGSGDASIDPGPGSGPVTQVSGRISTSTWANRIEINSTVTVDPGATVTVAAGTTVNFGSSGGLAVSGTLDIQGSQAARVVFRGATGGFWNTISVSSSGTVKASYLVQLGGIISITGGKATIVDSQLARARGDLLVMQGGTLDMSYSQIGLELGQSDTTHCDLHVSNAPQIKLTHSNISTSAYGIMFYGGTNADFTYNNWFGNDIDVDPTLGVVSGDFSHSYFGNGAPRGVGLTANDVQAARLASAGVGAPR